MSKVVLISCVKEKLNKRTKAEFLYTSDYFKLNLTYAKSLNPDKIFILSAKHGLIKLDDEIDPYEKTLNNMGVKERKKWASKVVDSIGYETDIKEDEFVILAGGKYREFLLDKITNYKIPMKELGIGDKLKWLLCHKMYNWIHTLPRYSFPFEKETIPKNGIYILFEKGEKYNQFDRVVRIGTHNGQDNLPKRLTEHFITENKDRSIFRKNIGRAILNRDNDSFIHEWNIDLTAKVAREEYKEKIDLNYIKNIEKKVTDYIQNYFSFVIIEIAEKEERLYYEKKLISLFSNCKFSYPSNEWLGNYSPKKKIRESGLWQEQELWKKSLTGKEMDMLINNKLRR